MSDDRNIVHRNLETDGSNPSAQVAEIVADLEGEDVRSLPSIWDCIDHLLDHIFSNPPSAEAQAEVTFSYYGYRITVEQNGRAKLVKTE